MSSPAPTISTPPTRAHTPRHAGKHTAARTLALAGETPTATEPAASPTKTPTAESTAARAALVSGDAPRALQLYRKLAQGTGPSAENAAYEVGEILNEKLGQPANAVAAWRRYRASYPEGILGAEADVSIIETLARIGDGDGALLEANDFLRAKGDCRHAVSAYEITLRASRPHDVVEAAAFQRAACLVLLGNAGDSEPTR